MILKQLIDHLRCYNPELKTMATLDFSHGLKSPTRLDDVIIVYTYDKESTVGDQLDLACYFYNNNGFDWDDTVLNPNRELCTSNGISLLGVHISSLGYIHLMTPNSIRPRNSVG